MHYFQLAGLMKLSWNCMEGLMYVPWSFFSLVSYSACTLWSVYNDVRSRSSPKREHLLGCGCFRVGFLFSSVCFKIKYVTTLQRKYWSVHFLTCSHFALVTDAFFDGGPVLKEILVNNWLDLEEDEMLTIRECWWKRRKYSALKYMKNEHGLSDEI